MVRFVRKHGVGGASAGASRCGSPAMLPLSYVRRLLRGEQEGVLLKLRGVADALRGRPDPARAARPRRMTDRLLMELRSFARGGLFGLITLVVEKGVALLLVVGLARVLSPVDYGRYSFLIAYLTLFQVLADLGTETILLRRLRSAPGGARSGWSPGALGLRVTLALLAGDGCGRCWCRWSTRPSPSSCGARHSPRRRCCSSASPATARCSAPSCAWARCSAWRPLTNVLVARSGRGGARAGLGIDGVFVALAAANLGGFALAALLARALFRFRLAVDLALWRELLREAWPIGANVLVFTRRACASGRCSSCGSSDRSRSATSRRPRASPMR